MQWTVTTYDHGVEAEFHRSPKNQLSRSRGGNFLAPTHVTILTFIIPCQLITHMTLHGVAVAYVMTRNIVQFT
jgi:hypothetical protein